jgi:hypothetical protein
MHATGGGGSCDHWFNETHFYGAIGHIPPIEYYCQITAQEQPSPGGLALH